MVRRNKKLNKLYNPSSFSSILRKAATNEDDLKKLANEIGIDSPIRFHWISSYNPKTDLPQILNIGSPSPRLSGTHWVAIYKNMYFDPYGMPPPPEVIFKKRNIGYIPLTIQSSKSGACGQYCVLFIKYALEDRLEEFYSMFNMTNTFSMRDIDQSP